MNSRCEVTYRNFVLDGERAFNLEKVVSQYEVFTKQKRDGSTKIVRKLIEENVTSLTFPLLEVTAVQVAMCRKKGIASFVLKKCGKLYWTKIPRNINLVSSELLGTHKCAVSGDVCRYVTAASDKEGGCEKIRNESTYIERYEWIPTGYETFNTSHDAFVVVKCEKYENCPEKPQRSLAEVQSLKLSLAQLAFEDDTFYPQGVARKKRSHMSNVNRF